MNPKVRELLRIKKEEKVSFNELGERSGVCVRTIQKWPYRKNGPTIACIEATLNALGYDLIIKKQEEA